MSLETCDWAEVPKNATHRCVYLLIAGTAFKIGISKDRTAQDRVKALQTGNPNPINVLRVSPFTVRARELEKQLHDQYSACKLEGEWFNLTIKQAGDVITFLDNIKEELSEGTICHYAETE